LFEAMLTISYRAVRMRSHIIYNDMALNSRRAVFTNVYQNFVITAMKMHNYVKGLGISTSHHSFLLRECGNLYLIISST